MFRVHRLLCYLVFLFSLLAFASQWSYFIHHYARQQGIFLFLFSALACVSLAMSCSKVDTRLEFVLSTFVLIIAWRLASLAHLELSQKYYFMTFIGQFLIFICLAYLDHQKNQLVRPAFIPHMEADSWHLLFVRMFIGYDLIPHFCEKLFAGYVPRNLLIHDFWSLGVPHAKWMVLLSGVCELAGALSISCGFFTRIGAVGLTGYLLIATILGHHFDKGFIWADVGGGWEFPVFWLSLILSFVVQGGGRFSIDGYLQEKYHVPKLMRWMMGTPIKTNGS